MPISATSNTSLTYTDQDAFKAAMRAATLTAISLKPLTRYDCYIENIESNWAVKPIGGNLGAPLITDINGKVSFILYHEI